MPSTRRTAVVFALLSTVVAAPLALAKPPAGGDSKITYAEGERTCTAPSCQFTQHAGADTMQVSAGASGLSYGPSETKATNSVVARMGFPATKDWSFRTAHAVVHIRRAHVAGEAAGGGPAPTGRIVLFGQSSWYAAGDELAQVVLEGPGDVVDQDVSLDWGVISYDGQAQATLGLRAVGVLKPQCYGYGDLILGVVVDVARCYSELSQASVTAEVDAQLVSFTVS